MIARISVALVFLASLFAVPAIAGDKKGSFRSSGKYKVRGSVKVSMGGKITLSGFSTTSGPDLYVYVGKGRASRRVAKLRRNSGSQSYSIPASVAKSISSVHIYCKKFSSNFGTARVN